MQSTTTEEWAKLLALRDRGLPWTAPECLAISDKLEVGLKSYFDASCAAKAAPLLAYENAVLYAMIGDTWEPELTGSLAGFDFRPQLADLRMPVLVMAGRWDDATMPAVTIPYRQFAPQAQFVMLERSGHQPFLEEPELALATLRAFLAH
jgi:proline iminopeptidase